MRLIIHTMYYPPEMGAPQARLSDLARRLRLRGNDVEVITALPNYPTGEIFKGYPKCYVRERIEDVQVHRSWVVPSNQAQMMARLISYLSFCLSSFVVGMVKGGRMQVMITESPPLFLAMAGWVVSALKGAKWILNVSDLWPDSAKYIGMLREDGLIYRLLKAMAHFLYKKASLVTGQSKEIITEIRRQVPSAATFHLSNGVDPEVFTPACRSDEVRKGFLREGEIGFIYAGLHGLFQGLEQVILAAAELKGKPVHFVFLGDGPEKNALIRRAERFGLENVSFYAPVPYKQMPSVLASMDVAVITLKSRILGAVPSKIYEAMSSSVPILLVAEGEAKQIVDQAKCGLTVAPGDVPSLVKAVRELSSSSRLRRNLGQAGRHAAQTFYNRAKILEEFERTLLNL